MACPTCDHTLQAIGDVGQRVVAWWCPRCGTIKFPGGCVEKPKLVERCRCFEQELDEWASWLLADWRKAGIAESINRPGRRGES